MPAHFLTICKASAGSGKTFALATEYVANLIADLAEAGGAAPVHRHTLAMTFTNKATAEMKQRIMEHLYDLAADRPGGFRDLLLERLRERGCTPAEGELPRLAAVALRGIVHDYDHFAVVTIDAFFQRLLTALAHELGLPADFRVDLNDREAVGEAVDNLLRRPSREVMAWLRDYIGQRMEEAENWHIADDIKHFAAANVLSEDYWQLPAETTAAIDNSETMTAYIASLRSESRKLRELLRETAATLAADFRESGLGEVCSSRCGIETYLREMVAERKPRLAATLQSIMDGEASPLLKKHQADAHWTAAAELFVEKLAALEAERKKVAPFLNTCTLILKNLRGLRLLRAIAVELDRVNERHNRFLLSKQKLLFRSMVGTSDAPFVFERAGNQYRHVMIDEFQDTARTQWENIRSLLLNAMAAGNTNLIVGDVKQSIYRWNGGDWQLLASLQDDRVLSAIGGVLVRPLCDNWRSRSGIVEFNNRFFPVAARLLDEGGGTTSLQQIYAPSTTTQTPRRGEGGYVRAVLSADNACPLAADSPLSLTATLHSLHDSGLPWSDLFILVRRNSEAETLVSLLGAQPDGKRIPVVTDEAFRLGSSVAVQLLVAAMRYMVCPQTDTVAAAYVAEVYQNLILRHGLSKQQLAENFASLLPAGFAENIPSLLDTPLYELCLRLIEIFQADKLPEGAAYVLSFLDEVTEFLQENPSDLRLFLRHWEASLNAKAIPASRVDAVRIYSIHKSKGLEFHTVLIPFCDWSLDKSQKDSSSFVWWDTVREPFNTLAKVPVAPSAIAEESDFAAQYAEEMHQRHVDNLNLAYVAFTRPKHNLYIWGEDCRKPQLGTMGALLQQTLSALQETAAPPMAESACDDGCTVYVKGKPILTPTPQSSPEDAHNPFVYHPEGIPMTMRAYPIRAEFRQSNDSQRFIREVTERPTDRYALIDRGKLCHRIMQDIRQAADMPNAIHRLVAEGLIAQSEEAALTLQFAGFLAFEPAAGWFDGTWKVFNETTLLQPPAGDAPDAQPEAYRPDRVMTKGEKTVVVDFKFAQKESGKYIKQVSHYAELLRSVGKTDVEGYIWYVDKNKIISL